MVGDSLNVPVLRIATLQNDTDGTSRLGARIFRKTTCMLDAPDLLIEEAV